MREPRRPIQPPGTNPPFALRGSVPSEYQRVGQRPRAAGHPGAGWLYVLAAMGAVLAVAAAAMAENGVHSAFAIVALVAIVAMGHRPGEPPALLFAAVFQWLQASTLLFLSDWRGEPIADEWTRSAALEATYLTLIGVVCFAAGARLGAGRPPILDHAVVEETLSALSLRRVVVGWAAGLALAAAVSVLAYAVPAVTQLVLALAQVRWVMIFVLAAMVFRARAGYSVLALVVLVEAVYGMLGYFSAFKNVFVVTAMGVLFVARSNPRAVRLQVVGLVPLVLLLGVYWTGVKDDYRSFLNQGTRTQVVLVSPMERVRELIELAAAQTGQQLADAAGRGLERVAYVSKFAAALDYVPSVVAHQAGALWAQAIWHVLVPRAVDPDKPAIDDSERTMEFTGQRVPGAAEGTSISLGYIAESYIDFGPVLMHVPILLWGVLVGAGYRLLSRMPSAPLLGLGCGTVLVVFNAHLVESSNVKMLGGFVTVLLVLWLVMRFLGARVMRALSA